MWIKNLKGKHKQEFILWKITKFGIANKNLEAKI